MFLPLSPAKQNSEASVNGVLSRTTFNKGSGIVTAQLKRINVLETSVDYYLSTPEERKCASFPLHLKNTRLQDQANDLSGRSPKCTLETHKWDLVSDSVLTAGRAA